MVQQSPVEDIGTSHDLTDDGLQSRWRPSTVSSRKHLRWNLLVMSGPSRTPGDEAFEDVFVLLSQRPSDGPGTADGTSDEPSPVLTEGQLDPLVQDRFGSKT